MAKFRSAVWSERLKELQCLVMDAGLSVLNWDLDAWGEYRRPDEYLTYIEYQTGRMPEGFETFWSCVEELVVKTTDLADSRYWADGCEEECEDEVNKVQARLHGFYLDLAGVRY